MKKNDLSAIIDNSRSNLFFALSTLIPSISDRAGIAPTKRVSQMAVAGAEETFLSFALRLFVL
jgi:hypothetical protein